MWTLIQTSSLPSINTHAVNKHKSVLNKHNLRTQRMHFFKCDYCESGGWAGGAIESRLQTTSTQNCEQSDLACNMSTRALPKRLWSEWMTQRFYMTSLSETQTRTSQNVKQLGSLKASSFVRAGLIAKIQGHLHFLQNISLSLSLTHTHTHALSISFSFIF